MLSMREAPGVFSRGFVLWSQVNSVPRRGFVSLLPVNLAGEKKNGEGGQVCFEGSSRSLLANVRGGLYYTTSATLVQVTVPRRGFGVRLETRDGERNDSKCKGGPTRIRTRDQPVMSRPLYR